MKQQPRQTDFPWFPEFLSEITTKSFPRFVPKLFTGFLTKLLSGYLLGFFFLGLLPEFFLTFVTKFLQDFLLDSFCFPLLQWVLVRFLAKFHRDCFQISPGISHKTFQENLHSKSRRSVGKLWRNSDQCLKPRTQCLHLRQGQACALCEALYG